MTNGLTDKRYSEIWPNLDQVRPKGTFVLISPKKRKRFFRLQRLGFKQTKFANSGTDCVKNAKNLRFWEFGAKKANFGSF